MPDAFNNIDRNAMFKEVRQHLPGLSAWSYALGKDTCVGVQQGDPLGPLGFTEVPTLNLNAWYLDDGTAPTCSSQHYWIHQSVYI